MNTYYKVNYYNGGLEKVCNHPGLWVHVALT